MVPLKHPIPEAHRYDPETSSFRADNRAKVWGCEGLRGVKDQQVHARLLALCVLFGKVLMVERIVLRNAHSRYGAVSNRPLKSESTTLSS